jgi:glutaconyl-CoA/methylmalonyl-CoA decarboxylase subunit gamma
VRLKITVDNKAYEVEVEVADADVVSGVRYVGGNSSNGGGGPTLVAPVAAGAAGGKEPSDEAKAVRSPLAGVVSEVHVAPGDVVEADQPVVVLEAMKMFTTVTSPIAGTIKSVEIAKTDGVKQGQLLMELE